MLVTGGQRVSADKIQRAGYHFQFLRSKLRCAINSYEEHLTFSGFAATCSACTITPVFTALRSGLPVQPVFIFDRNILDALEDRSGPSGCFHPSATGTAAERTEANSGRDPARWLWSSIGGLQETLVGRVFDPRSVFTNHD